jgi:hypothetical protein
MLLFMEWFSMLIVIVCTVGGIIAIIEDIYLWKVIKRKEKSARLKLDERAEDTMTAEEWKEIEEFIDCYMKNSEKENHQ